ncbi:MAG: Ig-like domain-containing protein [Myxococcota bacterium]
MTILFAMLAAPAWACEDDDAVDVLAISPEDGAMGVPLDARIVLQVRGRGPLASIGVDLVGSRGVVQGEWSAEHSEGQMGIWTFTPDEPFEPNLSYAVELSAPPGQEDSAYADAWRAGFTTGEQTEGAFTVAPSVALWTVGQQTEGVRSRCEPDLFRRVELAVSPGETHRPSEEWMLVYLQDGDEDRLLEAKRVDARDWEQPVQLLVPDAGSAFCVFAVHRGASGLESVSEPACFEPEPLPGDVAYYGSGACTGCSSASPVMGVWLLLPWFLRRRR